MRAVGCASLRDLLLAIEPAGDVPGTAEILRRHAHAGAHRCPRCSARSATVLDAVRAWCAQCHWRGTRWGVVNQVLGDARAIERLLCGWEVS